LYEIIWQKTHLKRVKKTHLPSKGLFFSSKHLNHAWEETKHSNKHYRIHLKSNKFKSTNKNHQTQEHIQIKAPLQFRCSVSIGSWATAGMAMWSV